MELPIQKKAKVIADGAGIALTETYLTLQELKKKGLIWRIGQKYKYRFGLKEGSQLDNLVQLYNSLALGQALPPHLQISPQAHAELYNRTKLNKEIALKEREEEIIIQNFSSNIRFLSREGRKEAITKCISGIIQFYSKGEEYTTDEEINDFLKDEFSSIFSILYAAKIQGEN